VGEGEGGGVLVADAVTEAVLDSCDVDADGEADSVDDELLDRLTLADADISIQAPPPRGISSHTSPKGQSSGRPATQTPNSSSTKCSSSHTHALPLSTVPSVQLTELALTERDAGAVALLDQLALRLGDADVDGDGDVDGLTLAVNDTDAVADAFPHAPPPDNTDIHTSSAGQSSDRPATQTPSSSRTSATSTHTHALPL
jgi:hypothetical protein